MMKIRVLFLVGTVLAGINLAGCTTDSGGASGLDTVGQSISGAVDEIATGVETGVNSQLTGEDIVRGRVLIQSPLYGYLTCFKNIRNGYVSTYPITNPSQAQGTPMMILTRDGVVAGALCDDLETKGLLFK